MFTLIVNRFYKCYRTWRNAQIGEGVVQNLEEKGQKMAQERQEMIGMLFIV